MKTLYTILSRPRDTFRALRERPRWLVPFLLLAASHVIVLVAGDANTVRAVLAHLPSSATIADKAEVAAMFADELAVRCVFQPIRLLAAWCAFSGILYLLTRLLKPPEPVPFVRVLALEVHAETVLLLAAVSGFLSPFLAGLPAERGVLTPPFSAAWLLPVSASFPFFSLLSSVHIFTLWYVVILTMGIRDLCSVSLRNSAVIAVCAWTLSVLFDLGILTLLIERLHFQV